MKKKTLNSFYFNKYISRIRLRLGHRVRINFVSDIQLNLDRGEKNTNKPGLYDMARGVSNSKLDGTNCV